MLSIIGIGMAMAIGYRIERLGVKRDSDLLRYLVAPAVAFTIILGFALLED